MAMSTRDSRDTRRRLAVINGGISKKLCTGDGLRTRDEDYKNYAENTMNELLAWYGYDKVNSGEARDLSIHHRTRRPSSSSTSLQETSSPSRGEEASEEMSEKELSGPDIGGADTPLLDVESVTQQTGPAICAWCLKEGLKLFTLKTAGGLTKVFCSELCFDQCRRAAFKKNRICDWCKHVRHTVNYVDFQDKDHQLQFCSDKCLNQYKMNIFCRETQAYLQMNPHLRDANDAGSSSGTSLITPDLWMKDCKEFTNGHLNFSDDDDEDSVSSEQPSAFKPTSSTNQNTDNKISFPGSSLDESISNEKVEKSDRSMKSENKLLTETNEAFKLDQEKQKLDRRKKLKDRSSKLDRKSNRAKELNNEKYDVRPSMSLPPKPIFSPDILQQTLSSQSYHQSPSNLINGPIPPKPTKPSSPTITSMSQVPTTLPPPPPLLNSEFLPPHTFPNSTLYQPSPFNLFSQQQQQLEAFLAMQSGLGMRFGSALRHPRIPVPEFLPRNTALNINNVESFSNSMIPPSTMMLPYPVAIPIPMPVPIPIPISSSHFQNLRQTKDKSLPQKTASEQGKRVDSIISKLITKHNEEKSNNRESKKNDDNYKDFDKNDFLDSSPSRSSNFINFCSESNQCHLSDYRRDKQKLKNECPSGKIKHLKMAEIFHS